MKKIRLVLYASFLLSKLREPVSSAISDRGTSVIVLIKASTCYETRGFVGAKKNICPLLNHL